MQFNLADLFESFAAAVPDRLALVSGSTRLTYAQLNERGTRLANHWRAHGIGPGDHVGLYLFNGHEYVEAMLAAFKLRARTVNVNYRYVAAELADVVARAEVVAIFHEPELAGEVDAIDINLGCPQKCAERGGACNRRQQLRRPHRTPNIAEPLRRMAWRCRFMQVLAQDTALSLRRMFEKWSSSSRLSWQT